jgi:hypothetical protein
MRALCGFLVATLNRGGIHVHDCKIYFLPFGNSLSSFDWTSTHSQLARFKITEFVLPLPYPKGSIRLSLGVPDSCGICYFYVIAAGLVRA